jgi:hypothetical protein
MLRALRLRRPISISTDACFERTDLAQPGSRATRLAVLLVGSLLVLLTPTLASAQGWGEDDWEPAPDQTSNTNSGAGQRNESPTSPWSLRAGMGFTADPDDFLLNFELPYRFDQYVSVGPMIQVGLGERRYIVAPTANLTITIPDMPGETLDRFHPHFFGGIGFAVIENEERGGSNRGAGFLANAGVGVDYALSERVSVGSRMIFNFLPGRTLDEKFFYSWEIIGLKLDF